MEHTEFKTYDRVLVRDDEYDAWQPDFFAYYINKRVEIHSKNYDYYTTARYATTSGRIWVECIPYADNEDLTGTCGKPKPNPKVKHDVEPYNTEDDFQKYL